MSDKGRINEQIRSLKGIVAEQENALASAKTAHERSQQQKFLELNRTEIRNLETALRNAKD
ncbi:hypothetical protein ACFVWT_18550 [Arthrobacter sp. NPDC058288]|uniref:hypothetical protein n=1 Tax=Arthrobacter sp. NPDC058288 TaxID=3346424 RepID=UPI0036E3719A